MRLAWWAPGPVRSSIEDPKEFVLLVQKAMELHLPEISLTAAWYRLVMAEHRRKPQRLLQLPGTLLIVALHYRMIAHHQRAQGQLDSLRLPEISLTAAWYRLVIVVHRRKPQRLLQLPGTLLIVALHYRMIAHHQRAQGQLDSLRLPEISLTAAWYRLVIVVHRRKPQRLHQLPGTLLIVALHYLAMVSPVILLTVVWHSREMLVPETVWNAPLLVMAEQ